MYKARRGGWSVLPALQSLPQQPAAELAMLSVHCCWLRNSSHFSFLISYSWRCCGGLSGIFHTCCFYLLFLYTYLRITDAHFLAQWETCFWWYTQSYSSGGAEEHAVWWSWMPGACPTTWRAHVICRAKNELFLGYRGVVPTLSQAKRWWNLCDCVKVCE